MSLTQGNTRYMPEKVLSLAQDMGVHDECVEADYEGACSGCATIFHIVFETFYGHANSANDALMMILSDIMDDKDTNSK